MITFQRPDATVVGSISQNAASTVAYNTSSDKRIKENITPTSFGLTDLMKIKVSDFSFITDPNHGKVTGFIAQDLQNIYPDAVTTNGDNGEDAIDSGKTPWMVDYGKLTPLLVKSTQELSLSQESMNLRVSALEANALGENSNSLLGNLGQYVSVFFSDVLKKVDNGLAYISGLVTGTLEVGTPEAPSGITLYDKTTKLPLCIEISDGVIQTTQGKCAVAPTTSSLPAPTLSSGPAPESTLVKDNISPVITLLGESTITMNVGDTYSEVGASATDNVDTSMAIIMSGSVNTTTPGVYTITYNATDTAGNGATEVTRTVSVLGPEVTPDTQNPTDTTEDSGTEVSETVDVVDVEVTP